MARFRQRFYDPAFDSVRKHLDAVADKAWEGCIEYRKTPRTTPAGAGFADPDFELPVEWLETRRRLGAAEKKQKAPRSRSRVLIVCGASRSDETPSLTTLAALQSLVAHGEYETLEFKRSTAELRRAGETLCARSCRPPNGRHRGLGPRHQPGHRGVSRPATAAGRSALVAFAKALETLPETHPLAPEDIELGSGVRQALYVRPGSTYRILFVVDEDVVHVLAVRHGARRWLESDELRRLLGDLGDRPRL
jgi:hypothetical protein